MSDRDLYLTGGGSTWGYGLGALLFVLAVIAWCWCALHGGSYLLTVWRRGRAYRRRLRAARHRRNTGTHLAFRKATSR